MRALVAMFSVVCCFAIAAIWVGFGERPRAPQTIVAEFVIPTAALVAPNLPLALAKPRPKHIAPKKVEPKYLDLLTALRLTTSASHDVGIPVAFVRAIMRQESGGDVNAHSSAGALGLMQMLPAVAREWGAVHPYDAYENMYAATRYIAYLRTRYHGDVALTAAAYNAGPGTVDQYHGVPPYPETKRYVAAVVESLHASLHPVHATDE